MSRYLPTPTGLVVTVGLVLGGCGRFGFELQGVTQERKPSSRDDPGGDAGESRSGDVGATDAAAEPGFPDPPDFDAGFLRDGGSQLGSDAAVNETDAAIEPDAGLSALVPRSTTLNCDTYAGVVACDDFDGHKSGARVTPMGTGNTVQIQDGFVTASVAGTSSRAAVETRFNALTSGAVFMRFSLFVPSALELRGLNIATLGAPDFDFGLALYVRGNSLRVYTSGDTHLASVDYTMPRDRWVCVLLKVDNIDSQNGSIRLLLDGQQVLSASPVDTRPSFGIVRAAAGIDWAFADQPQSTLHVDGFLVTRDHPGSCP